MRTPCNTDREEGLGGSRGRGGERYGNLVSAGAPGRQAVTCRTLSCITVYTYLAFPWTPVNRRPVNSAGRRGKPCLSRRPDPREWVNRRGRRGDPRRPTEWTPGSPMATQRRRRAGDREMFPTAPTCPAAAFTGNTAAESTQGGAGTRCTEEKS